MLGYKIIYNTQIGENGECENGDGVDGEESEEVKGAKVLEVEAVRAAEGGSLGDALELLNQAVSVAPNYASPYNNRAQVQREGERERERERECVCECVRESTFVL